MFAAFFKKEETLLKVSHIKQQTKATLMAAGQLIKAMKN